MPVLALLAHLELDQRVGSDHSGMQAAVAERVGKSEILVPEVVAYKKQDIDKDDQPQ